MEKMPDSLSNGNKRSKVFDLGDKKIQVYAGGPTHALVFTGYQLGEKARHRMIKELLESLPAKVKNRVKVGYAGPSGETRIDTPAKINALINAGDAEYHAIPTELKEKRKEAAKKAKEKREKRENKNYFENEHEESSKSSAKVVGLEDEVKELKKMIKKLLRDSEESSTRSSSNRRGFTPAKTEWFAITEDDDEDMKQQLQKRMRTKSKE